LDYNEVEVGSGKGGFAESYLDYFKNFHFPYYGKVHYTCLDISDYLLEQCKERLSVDHEALIKHKKIGFINHNFVEYTQKHNEKILFLLFEILDNLPHDKVLIDTESNLIFQRYSNHKTNSQQH
jgi:SAM-dependent MidA family methyltransferase